jgi:hypothetical protein
MNKSTIKITSRDNFVWKIVTDKAIRVWNTGLFCMYALHDDESESLVMDKEQLREFLEEGLDIAIEVGFVDVKSYRHSGML